MAKPEQELGRFAALFAALLFVLLMVPATSDEGPGAVWLRVAISAALAAGLYTASRSQWVLWIAVALAVPAVAAEWGALLVGAPSLVIARLALTTAFFFFTSGVVIRAILAQDRVSTDTILGGINVYLLLGIAFMLLHGLIETVQPAAYLIDGHTLGEHLAADGSGGRTSTLLYFSFTTLTTLGYGDIRPATSVAQVVSVVEAVVGQLYIAIFIARLVALHLTHSLRSES